MSTTRRAKVGSDPDAAPERYLASGRLRGLAVGRNIVSRVAAVLPTEERSAMHWLLSFARLRDLTGADLARSISCEPSEVREALTNPDANRSRFMACVRMVREDFEEALGAYRAPSSPSIFDLIPKFDEALGAIADTAVARKTANAFAMAETSPQMIEVVGKSRIGKSIAARRQFMQRMDRACYLHCPRGNNERDFLTALADALGVAVSTAYKPGDLIPKLRACFGRKKIRLLIVDEAHRIWPADAHAEPKRVEFLRDLYELEGVSVILLATPQYSAALEEAMKDNPRWAPGQWIGRTQVFDLPPTMTAADLRAVALHHAPQASAEVIDQLVSQAVDSEGFCGSMVKTIERCRFRNDGGPLTLEDVIAAQRLIVRETKAAALNSVVALPRRPLQSTEAPA